MRQKESKELDFEARALPQLDNLYRVAVYVLDNESDAKDVVQESLARAYHSWPEYQFSPDCRIWLFRIMANALTNKYLPSPGLSLAKNNADEIDDYFVHFKSENQQPVDDSGQIPFSAISEDDVKKAIGDLPDYFRLIVVLSLQEGFSYQEIADITGAQLEDVRFRLHQGRKLIRESLSSMWPAKAATG